MYEVMCLLHIKDYIFISLIVSFMHVWQGHQLH